VSTNYFFVSSPLHLLFSCNLALVHKDDENTVVLIPRETAHFSSFEDVLTRHSHIFDRVISFETGNRKGKYFERRRRMASIKKALMQRPADRIFTGTDRRVEFQYAMSVSSKLKSALIGIYLDDGMASYLGHKSMHNIAHMYIDPLFKKLFYGWWWNNPVTIGSSSWIGEAHVAYPELIHESLASKKVVPIDKQIFKQPQFIDLCEQLLRSRNVDNQSIRNVDAIIVLTHESFYPDAVAHLNGLVQAISKYDASFKIAIKPHPRSAEVERFKSLYSNILFLDSRVSMELYLPLVKDRCVIIGDISSALFTTRWFSENTHVIAVKLQQKIPAHIEDNLYQLFSNLGIVKMNVEELPEYLEKLNYE
jgi:hypothetical protein